MSTKKILVFGGGGVFGFIPLVLLRDCGVKDINYKVDFLSGSSIGGFVALSIACGYQPKDLYNLFKKDVTNIFHRPILRRLNPFRSKYSPTKFERFLKEHFCGKKMCDLPVTVIIPSLSFRHASPKIFTNFPGSPDLDTPVWEVARATTAAPSFFPPFGHDVLIDGGVIENIPVITATTAIRECFNLNFSEMNVFAFGAGDKRTPGPKTYRSVVNYTAFGWLTSFLVPYITKSNEISTNMWSKNMGYAHFNLYNPVKVKGKLDSYNQILSGKIEEDCFPYIADCAFKFSDFIHR